MNFEGTETKSIVNYKLLSMAGFILVGCLIQYLYGLKPMYQGEALVLCNLEFMHLVGYLTSALIALFHLFLSVNAIGWLAGLRRKNDADKWFFIAVDHGLDSWSTVPFTITIFSIFGRGEFRQVV